MVQENISIHQKVSLYAESETVWPRPFIFTNLWDSNGDLKSLFHELFLVSFPIDNENRHYRIITSTSVKLTREKLTPAKLEHWSTEMIIQNVTDSFFLILTTFGH